MMSDEFEISAAEALGYSKAPSVDIKKFLDAMPAKDELAAAKAEKFIREKQAEALDDAADWFDTRKRIVGLAIVDLREMAAKLRAE